MVWIKKTNASEPSMTRRKVEFGIRTGGFPHSRDKSGGILFTDQAVSGVGGGVILILARTRNLGTCRSDRRLGKRGST